MKIIVRAGKSDQVAQKASHPLVGRKIKAIRAMTKAEADREGWIFGRHHSPTVIVLDDNTLVYASQDPEGNGPGALFGFDGQTIMVQHA